MARTFKNEETTSNLSNLSNLSNDVPGPPSSPPFHESGEADRVRKNIKNERERNSRAHLKAKFDKLAELLEITSFARLHKGTVLDLAVRTMGQLKQENKELRSENIRMSLELNECTAAIRASNFIHRHNLPHNNDQRSQRMHLGPAPVTTSSRMGLAGHSPALPPSESALALSASVPALALSSPEHALSSSGPALALPSSGSAPTLHPSGPTLVRPSSLPDLSQTSAVGSPMCSPTSVSISPSAPTLEQRSDTVPHIDLEPSQTPKSCSDSGIFNLIGRHGIQAQTHSSNSGAKKVKLSPKTLSPMPTRPRARITILKESASSIETGAVNSQRRGQFSKLEVQDVDPNLLAVYNFEELKRVSNEIGHGMKLEGQNGKGGTKMFNTVNRGKRQLSDAYLRRRSSSGTNRFFKVMPNNFAGSSSVPSSPIGGTQLSDISDMSDVNIGMDMSHLMGSHPPRLRRSVSDGLMHGICSPSLPSVFEDTNASSFSPKHQLGGFLNNEGVFGGSDLKGPQMEFGNESLVDDKELFIKSMLDGDIAWSPDENKILGNVSSGKDSFAI